MQDSRINSNGRMKIHARTTQITGMLIQKINSRSRKDQIQQNGDQLQQPTLLGIRIICIDLIGILCVKSINTGELFPHACKGQIREWGK